MIADDHEQARQVLHELLEDVGFTVVAMAQDAREAIQMASQERPDLALLDVRMPGNGIRAAEAIAMTLPETAVVMLTASHADGDLFSALGAGAVGYLLKDSPRPRLLADLRRIARGEAAVSGRVLLRLVEQFRIREQHRLLRDNGSSAQLSAREWQVLALGRDGATTEEIADRLGISACTVRSHFSALMAKLGVSTRSEAYGLLRQLDGGEARNPLS